MWKDKFTELLFPTNPLEIKMEEALNLKFSKIPPSLFKYRSFDGEGLSLDILKNNEIMLSTPEKFNDPFDCGITFDGEKLMNKRFRVGIDSTLSFLSSVHEFTPDEIDLLKNSKRFTYDLTVILQNDKPFNEKMSINKAAELTESITNIEIQKISSDFSENANKGMFITCFSESNVSNVMWSNYADNHKGFCIEYDFKELGPKDPRTRMLYPIIYTDTLFDATEYFMEGMGGKTFNNLIFIYSSITKSKEWCLEKEWRYLYPLGPVKEPVYFPLPKIKAVHLGVRVSKINKNIILKLAKEKRFEVYQMEKDLSTYDLKSKKLF